MGIVPLFVSEGEADAMFADCDVDAAGPVALDSSQYPPLVFFRGESLRCGPLAERLLALDFRIEGVHSLDGHSWFAAFQSIHAASLRCP